MRTVRSRKTRLNAGAAASGQFQRDLPPRSIAHSVLLLRNRHRVTPALHASHAADDELVELSPIITGWSSATTLELMIHRTEKLPSSFASTIARRRSIAMPP